MQNSEFRDDDILDKRDIDGNLLPEFRPRPTELRSGTETVLIMNEGKLKRENYERLLHWRFGHTNSKVLQAMELIDKTHLNEDCYCCNKAKFKRKPFPKNEGMFVAVAEPYWRLFVDGFGGQQSLGGDSIEGAKGKRISYPDLTGVGAVRGLTTDQGTYR
jgi:hypothetical protein